MGNRLLKIKVKVFGLEIRGERLSKRVRISMLVAAVLIVVIAAAVSVVIAICVSISSFGLLSGLLLIDFFA